jgi:hypothetical protein
LGTNLILIKVKKLSGILVLLIGGLIVSENWPQWIVAYIAVAGAAGVALFEKRRYRAYVYAKSGTKYKLRCTFYAHSREYALRMADGYVEEVKDLRNLTDRYGPYLEGELIASIGGPPRKRG